MIKNLVRGSLADILVKNKVFIFMFVYSELCSLGSDKKIKDLGSYSAPLNLTLHLLVDLKVTFYFVSFVPKLTI